MNLRATGPSFALPVKAGRARARERLSSYREPASRNPQAVRWKTCWRSRTPAPFRRLPIRAPRQTWLRTSSWLAPSRFTNGPCDLPVEKTRDASNRRMPPNRTACTRISRVPGSLIQLSLAGRPTESRAPCGMTGGPDVSRRPRPLRRIASSASPRAGFAPVVGVGVFGPRRLCDRTSDTPVATRACPSRLAHLRGRCILAVPSPFGRLGTGRRARVPPRPPSTSSRESRRLVRIRGAFYR